jgi:hypothetical protein
MLDAIAGYTERENETIKAFAGLIRTSTAILWNIQVGRGDKKEAHELWPFPWETEELRENVSDEEYKKREDQLIEALMKHGRGNNKS